MNSVTNSISRLGCGSQLPYCSRLFVLLSKVSRCDRYTSRSHVVYQLQEDNQSLTVSRCRGTVLPHLTHPLFLETTRFIGSCLLHC
jgi:hypothetical protein